ncbi:Crotonobetaine/carnitine--CoA ligase [Mycolicibacterium vanbaalenii]|uniref:Crotonobetaine/carnitine--CoA ligase n=1 Tax=Mycolicibacterium vanbaalenii TaxID=110539 RepID=A0A5S9N0E8_MYCVN|nr:AMP-binding protein [Mycolicibacterium vanbaalenii]CAA0083057.1 Crotonobetaine/carnitine--CoA ligase [Mycolicibacterium vanbaalenii]
MTLPATGECTVAGLLDFWSRTTPDAPFIVFDPLDDDPHEFSYRDVWVLAVRAAEVLSSLGLRRGDRFAVALGNHPDFFAYWFGAALTGTVFVPVNPASTADELQYYFQHAKCRAVICSTTNRDTVKNAWAGAPSAIVVADRQTRTTTPNFCAIPVGLTPDEPLAIMYTSGTTSRPKGVVVTHANYLSAGHTVAEQLRIRPDDRWLVVLPLFHANAQYYCTMSALVSGASLVVSARFSASRWGDQARSHGVTLASLFAAPIRMILAAPVQAGDHTNWLRAVIFAQCLTDQQLGRFENRFSTTLLQLYGMTETMAPPLMNPLYGRIHNQTIGLPTAANRVRIVADGGSDALPGESGELLVGGVAGETLMTGYLDDEQATAETIVDGWLRTGDLVERRDDGYVVFTDRAKDMIKRSGENVAAAEVERVINTCPQVFESAVIGIPDPLRDEAIKAYVVLQDGSSEVSESSLIEFCSRTLPRGKVPDVIEFVADLPRTSVGKIRKQALRATAGAVHAEMGQ